MKTRKSLAMALTVVVSLAAGALLVWQIPPEHVADHPIAQSTADTVVTPETSSGDVPLSAQQMDDRLIANTITSDAGDTLSSNTEMVMGLRVKKNRDCVVTRHYLAQLDGTTIEAFSCEPISDNPRVMDHYTDDALKELAYSDPVASFELGRRLILREDQQETATEYLLRSVALDDTDLEGIHIIVRQRFWNQFSEKNGLDMRTRAYVFNALATTLDENNNYKKRMSFDRLVDAGLGEEQILALENETRKILDDLIAIQRDVTGSSTIEARVGS